MKIVVKAQTALSSMWEEKGPTTVVAGFGRKSRKTGREVDGPELKAILSVEASVAALEFEHDVAFDYDPTDIIVLAIDTDKRQEILLGLKPEPDDRSPITVRRGEPLTFRMLEY